MNDFKKKLKNWLSFVLVLWFLCSRYGIEELPMKLLGIEIEEEQEKEQEEEEHLYHHICECDKMRKEDNEDDDCSHRGKQ